MKISSYLALTIFLFFLVFYPVDSNAEGSAQVRFPDSTGYASLYINTGYTSFGTYNCPANYRLYIYLKNVNESVLFGFNSATTRTFRLKKPDGTIVLSGATPNAMGQTGFIRWYSQALTGPFPSLNGYTPLSYTVASIADTGKYYIEFSGNITFDLFDFTVVSGANTPAVPTDRINGRVYSASWQFYANLNPFQPFNSRLFVYSDDGIVTRLDFNQAHVGAVTIFCNPFGCLNTGNFSTDRQSKNSATYTTFPGIAQYKVFLNNPDSLLFPSGVYGQMTAAPYVIPDTNYAPCSGYKFVVVTVNKAGNVSTKIDVPYGDPSYDVDLYAIVGAGINYIPWNGKDGKGGQVPDGTQLTITVSYVNGLTNLPIWDQEQNPNGYTISLIRPISPGVQFPMTYWDDTQITTSGQCNPAPNTSNLLGCLPGATGCHPWPAPDCHDKMINTWWYSASSSTASLDLYYTGTPPNPIPHGSSRCGPGIDTITVTVLASETVDWYATPTGGAPLLVGDTTYISPYLTTTTTYYAEARNDTSGCISVARTPVTVTIFPLPDVVFTPNNQTTCSGDFTNIALTSGVPNTEFEWTVTCTNPFISGYGPGYHLYSINQQLYNTGTYSDTVFYHVTGTANGCPGPVFTVKVVVTPRPQLTTSPLTQFICSLDSTNIPLTANITGTTFSWIASLASGTASGFSNGSGSLIRQKLTNISGFPAQVKYTITPTFSGCSGTPVDYYVTVYPLPIPTISGPDSLCIGLSKNYVTEAGNSSYNWNVSGGGTITSGAGTNSITVQWTSAGTHTLSVNYVDVHSCTALAPTLFNVRVFPLPVPTISGPSSICVNSKGYYTTETGMTGYTWNVTGGSVTAGGGTNTAEITWTGVGPQTVTVNYISTKGCTAAVPTSYPVTVHSLPVPTISGTSSICSGFTTSYVTESGMSGYNWIISAGGTILSGTGTDSIVVQWNMPGPQTLSVNYTDLNSCTAASPTVKNITVYALPVPTITGPAVACENTSKVYTTEAGMTNYSWTVPPQGTITAGGGTNSITVLWTAPGNFILSVNYINANSCTAVNPTTKNITVNPAPVPTISGNASVCRTLTYIYTTETGMTNYSWIVTGGTIVSGANTNTIQVNWTTAGTQTITLTYTDANTCNPINPSVKDITVNPLPVPAITGTNSVCEFQAGENYFTPLVAGNSYSWTITGGTISSGENTDAITVTWGTAGTGTLKVVETVDATGCQDSATYTITIHPLPVPTITGTYVVCENTSHTYTTEAGMTNYNWVVPPEGTITAGTGTNTITVFWTTPGNPTISVNYVNANNCTALNPTTLDITVNPAPVPSIIGSVSVCRTLSYTYTTEAGMSNYNWSVTGGTILSGGGTNSILVNWTTAGTQTITLTYTDINSCNPINPSTKSITVNPLPVPAITGPNSVCALQAGVNYSTPSVAGNNFSWTITGGAITGGTGTNAITVTWAAAGTGTLKVIETIQATGCMDSVSYSITIHPLPVPSLTGNASVCDSTSHVYTTDPGMTGYTWTVPPEGTVTAGAGTSAVTILWNTPGAHTISVNYTNGNNCTALNPTTFDVTVHALPVPSISGPGAMCLNNTGTYTTETGMTGYTWTVLGGTLVSGSGTNSIQVDWNTLGMQSVYVNYIDGFGCTATFPTVYSVQVNTLPVPTITGPAAVCQGLTGNYSTEGGMASYTWNVSSGGTITAGSGTSTITVLWNTVGPQTVDVNYVVGTGCTAPTPTIKNVTVNALPTPTITGNSVVCENTSHTYTTETGMTGYMWDVPPEGNITAGAGTNSITVLWISPGNPVISVNYTNSNNCTAVNPTTKDITVNPAPVPTITGSASVCISNTYSYTTQAGMTGYDWTVTGGTVTSGTGTNTIQVFWTSTGNQAITVTFTDINGCIPLAPTSKSITVNPLPAPAITGSLSVCALQSNVAYSTPNVIGNIYQWSITGGSITSPSTSNAITVTWGAAGTGTLKVVETIQATGCRDSVSAGITIHALPAPTISGATVSCANTSKVYTTEAGMTGYTWTVPPQGTITAGAGTNAITILWNTAGNHTISINYTNANNCTAISPTTYNVTVNPAPIPTLTGAASPCVSNTYAYTTEAGMSGYTWTLTGGTILSGSGTSNIQVLWTLTGAQTLTISYTDLNGCLPVSPTSKPVTVNPLPSPVISGPGSVCALQTNAEYSTPLVAGHTYVWTLTGGTFTSSPNTNAITVTWGSAGTGTLKVVETIQATGCKDSTSRSITINPLPAPVISGPNNICELSTQVYSTTTFAGHSYNWKISGGTIQSGQGTSTITVLWGGTGTATLKVIETIPATGCSDSTAIYTVTLMPYPVAAGSITGPASVCENSSGISYSVPAILYTSSYVWTYSGTGVTIINSGNTITVNFAAGATSGTLAVHGQNNCGNGLSSSLNIQVNPLPILSAIPCSDPITTTGAQPFKLKGVSPLGGTFTGAGVNAGYFYPSLAGPGAHVITYTYTNVWTCSASTTLTINVISNPPFACGNNVTDIRDNQQYPTVLIGLQCWFSVNLNYGTTIPSTSLQRDNCVPEKYCFNDNSANCLTQGGMYQWDELMKFTSNSGAQGLCPPGWHIPARSDWDALFTYYISIGFTGAAIKYDGYASFNGYLWGVRHENSAWNFFNFATMFWTSTSDGPYKAWAHGLNIHTPSVSSYPGSRSNAFPVRCLRD